MKGQNVTMTRREARLANLAMVETVSERVQASHQDALDVGWQLLDEANLAYGEHYVQYHAYRRDGRWYMTVESRMRGARKYGIIDAMLVRAMRHWAVVDSVLDKEPKTRVRKQVRRVQRMIDWMVQDAWDLRQPASAHTFRGILALFGEVVSRETISAYLKRKGLAKMHGNQMSVWLLYPDQVFPGTERPAEPTPAPSWLADVCLPSGGQPLFQT